MDKLLSAHPDLERLAAFRVGNVDPEELTQIEQHLAGCPSCCQSLKGLPDDSLVERMQKPFSILALPPDRTPAKNRDDTVSLTCDPAEATLEAAAPAELAEHPRYRVLGLLGVGGMGAVFKAEHLLMERTVALKVINRSLLAKPGVVERFRREVKAAARLAHPNIVHAYDADQAGDCHFLVMEYVEGLTLARMVKEQGPLPVATACDYARQTALGLQHAFEHGMVHRDIKPQNLILSGDRPDSPRGAVKILDFGLARLASEMASGEEVGQSSLTDRPPTPSVTTAGTLLGTADYVAPEQVDDPHAADIRADLYSLGCTLYYLLTGQPPFSEGDIMQRLKAHRHRRPQPLSAFRRDVPVGVQQVLDRMLAKEPALRFATPAEAARALAPFAEKPPARPSRGRLMRWAVAAVFVLTVGLAGWLYGPAVYRFTTNQGQLVIQTDDKDVELSVKQGGELIKIIDARTGREITLKAGTYQLELSEGKEALKLSTKEFTLTRGGKQIVRVTVVEDKPREIRRFEGHDKGVIGVSYAPDGRHALSTSYDMTVRLWDVGSGKEIQRFVGHTAWPYRAVLAPNGRVVLSGGDDRVLRIWDAQTGKELHTGEGHTLGIISIAVSPDGGRALTCSWDFTVRLWKVDTGEQLRVLEGHTAMVGSVAFSPDGKRALSGSADKTVRLWDLETGKELRSLEGHTEHVFSVAFAPDGRSALSGGLDKTVRLWNLETGKEIRNFEGHSSPVLTVVFTPDGRHVLTSATPLGREEQGERGVRLWDVQTGAERYRLKMGDSGSAGGVTVSPDCRYALISASWHPDLRLWRLPEPPPLEK